MHCKRWSLLAVCLAALCLFPTGSVLAEAGWDTKEVAHKAAELFQKSDFAGLETMVSELKKKGYDIRQAYPELSAFYSVFAIKDTESERHWLDWQTQLDGWSRAVPDSLSAKIVMANWYVEYAWKARGNGFANTVTMEGWQLMGERLRQAASILRSVPEEKIDDPEYYRLFLSIARGQGWKRAEMERCFEKGTALAREFFPLYESASCYLQARWYGQPIDCSRFAAEVAAKMPGDKGEVLYSLLARSEAPVYGEDYFTKSPVDYDRIKNAFLAEEQRNGPTKRAAQDALCYLAAMKGDKETATRLFLELGDAACEEAFGGRDAFLRLRKQSGAEEEIDQALTAERLGNLAKAERLWTSFHRDVATNPWLVRFYERQGMEAGLRGSSLQVEGALPAALLDADVATAPPDLLENLSRLYPQLGQWEKATAVAQAFNQKQPWNLTGKTTLWLCALQRGDRERAAAVRGEIAALKTDRPAYLAAQAILSGSKTWEETREALKTADQYLCQAATAIAVFYISQGDAKTAQMVIEQTLPLAPDTSERALLESLLYGSVARSLNAPAHRP